MSPDENFQIEVIKLNNELNKSKREYDFFQLRYLYSLNSG